MKLVGILLLSVISFSVSAQVEVPKKDDPKKEETKKDDVTVLIDHSNDHHEELEVKLTEEEIIKVIIKSVVLQASQSEYVNVLISLDRSIAKKEAALLSAKVVIPALAATAKKERADYILLIEEHNNLIQIMRMLTVGNEKKAKECNDEDYAIWSQAHIDGYGKAMAEVKKLVTQPDYFILEKNFTLMKEEIQSLKDKKTRIEQDCKDLLGTKEQKSDFKGKKMVPVEKENVRNNDADADGTIND